MKQNLVIDEPILDKIQNIDPMWKKKMRRRWTMPTNMTRIETTWMTCLHLLHYHCPCCCPTLLIPIMLYCCAVFLFYIVAVVLVLVSALVVAGVQSFLLSHCIVVLFSLCCCSCSSFCYCCHWHAVIFFFIVIVLHCHCHPCHHPSLLVAIMVYCCFALLLL